MTTQSATTVRRQPEIPCKTHTFCSAFWQSNAPLFIIFILFLWGTLIAYVQFPYTKHLTHITFKFRSIIMTFALQTPKSHKVRRCVRQESPWPFQWFITHGNLNEGLAAYWQGEHRVTSYTYIPQNDMPHSSFFYQHVLPLTASRHSWKAVTEITKMSLIKTATTFRETIHTRA